MKNKLPIIIISILLVLSTICTITGFIRYNQSTNNKNIEKTNNITFEYYLEDLKVNKMPTNEITASDSDDIDNNLYIFKRYNCTNNITGTFNEEEWNFETKGENGTCKLYFVNAKYNVELSIINGIQDNNNINIIERENDASFKIIPNEGYEFKEATCQNGKDVNWDEKNNTINISAITSNTSCTISFDKKSYDINISVINGKGNTSEKVLYGDSKSIIIEPNIGYNNPKIQCNNNQIATYSNNSLKFDKITNNATCTIIFNKIIIPIYTVTIENLEDFKDSDIIKIPGISKINNINEGTSFSLTINKPSNVEVNLNCGDIVPNEINIDLGMKKYEILDIRKDIVCTIETN